MSFGEKLLSLRRKHKLNQIKMSERLNISQSVYSGYERDEKEIKENDDFLKRVAEEFDVTRSWLLAEDDKDFPGFESGSMRPDRFSLEHSEHYYILPKDFVNAYLKQPLQMLEQILNLLGKKKIKLIFKPKQPRRNFCIYGSGYLQRPEPIL